MVAIDTNVLVRLIVQDDDDQVADARSFVASGAWVSNLVLAETVWVLKAVYRKDRNELIFAVERLVEHDTIILEDEVAAKAALENFRTSSALNFSDCLILQIARRAGHTPLGTFDRQLAKLDGARQISK